MGPVVGEGKISDEKGAWAQQAGCESEGRVSGRMRGLGPSTEAQGRAPSTGPITLLLCYHGTLVCKQRCFRDQVCVWDQPAKINRTSSRTACGVWGHSTAAISVEEWRRVDGWPCAMSREEV